MLKVVLGQLSLVSKVEVVICLVCKRAYTHNSAIPGCMVMYVIDRAEGCEGGVACGMGKDQLLNGVCLGEARSC